MHRSCASANPSPSASGAGVAIIKSELSKLLYEKISSALLFNVISA